MQKVPPKNALRFVRCSADKQKNMKPPLFVPIHRGAGSLVSGLRKRFAILLMAAIAMSMGTRVAFSQGPGTSPGVYYQANPPGYGVNTTSYDQISYDELSYVQSFMQSGYSLYNPVYPATAQPAGTAQLAAAVLAATNNLLSASPTTSVPAGVTAASIATQIVADNPAAATASGGTLAALASSIMANQSAANAFNGPNGLTSVISSLATSYPATIATLSGTIFTSAAANTQQVGNIPALALTATTATTAISGSDQTVGAIVTQAINAAATSSAPQAVMQNIVATQFGSSLINGSQASIGAISKSMIDTTAVATISSSNIASYVQAAVNALPAGAQTNQNAGAIFLGMVASGTIPETTISADLAGASGATAPQKAYLAAMNTGFNSNANTSGSNSISANLAANPGLIDAIVSGAVASGTVPNATLMTDALNVSGSTTPVQNIVAAAITSDLIKNTSDSSPTIAANAVAATTAANYALVAQGAVGGGRGNEAGSIAAGLIKGSPGYSAMASTLGASFTASNVQSLVQGSVTGAYSGAYGANTKPGAVGQIVYQSEVAASTFSGATSTQISNNLPLAEAVATQAIITMKAQDNVDGTDTPTYIAAAAAFAGYGGPATNLPSIQSMITTGTAGSDSSSNAITAINAVEPVVQNYRTLSSTGYTYTLTTLGTNAVSTAPDSVIAVLYGASLANPIDSSALLAAAIAKVPSALNPLASDSDAKLLSAAIYANPSNQPNLTIANTVALHVVTNLASHGVNNDISSFVGYQVAQNPTYVNDIAAAAVAVDPNQANYVARAVAYNNPQGGYTAIPSIFAYSQLTSKYNNASVAAGAPVNIDEASAAAAISGGYAAGLVQAAQFTATSSTVVQQAFVNGVSQAVGAAISQNNTRLTGVSLLQAPTSLSTLPGSPTITYSGGSTQGGGTPPTYSGTISSSPAVGAAGVVTGIISEVVTPGDTSFGGSPGGTSNEATLLNTSASSAAAIVNAILKATVYQVSGGATTSTLNTTNNGFVTQIAQAAGQAFGYINRINPSTDLYSSSTTALTQSQALSVADQMATDLTGLPFTSTANNYKLAIFAAYYGITRGQSGYLGAGATGVSANAPYSQNGGTLGNPVTGAPVTDIFNL